MAKEEIAESAQPSAGFFLMNLFATVVASYGLLSNSAAVVIGAMVIAVLLGPIAGIGLALVLSDRKLFFRALLAVSLGATEVLIVSFLIGSIHETPRFTSEILARTQPNLFDLIIALAGGAAGAYAVGRRVPGGTMIGVAIATALVPPLCTVGLTAAEGDWTLARGALLLFFSNFIAIQVAYSVVLYALRFRPEDHGRRSTRVILKNIAPSFVLFLGLAVFLGFLLEQRVDQQLLETQIRRSLRATLIDLPGAYLTDVQFTERDTLTVVASINTPEAITPAEVSRLEASLASALDRPLQLSVRSILVKFSNRDHFMYEQEEIERVEDIPQPTAPPLLVEQADSLIQSDTLRPVDTSRVDSTTPSALTPNRP